MQQRQDSPPEYFFSFNASHNKVGSVPEIVASGLARAFKANGINDQMKLEIFTEGPNSILMRIENIADAFDSNGEVISQTVNVQGLARQLYEVANGSSFESLRIDIRETSLTSNQSYEEMSQRKLRWKTVDDQPSDHKSLFNEPLTAM
jgi:hypothetical protein